MRRDGFEMRGGFATAGGGQERGAMLLMCAK